MATDARQHPSQVLHSVALDSRDAVFDSESQAYRFDIPMADPKLRALRISLGSLEFTPSQYLVEPAWARLYFSEGIRIDDATDAFRVRWRRPGGGGDATTRHLARHLNFACDLAWDPSTATLTVTTVRPHGLFQRVGFLCLRVPPARTPRHYQFRHACFDRRIGTRPSYAEHPRTTWILCPDVRQSNCCAPHFLASRT